MNAQDVIEATKKRADWARDVESSQQKLNDACGYWLTQSQEIQDQGFVLAIEALNKLANHKGMSVVLRAGVGD